MSVQSVSDHEERVSRLINLRVWAVVGVSQDPEKYGHRVFLTLLESGYQVMGVNLKGGFVAGHRVFPSLADIPESPEVVVTVVPPPVTEQIVVTCKELGIKHIWMQPGSESDTATSAALSHGMTVVAHDCAMVRRKQWQDAS